MMLFNGKIRISPMSRFLASDAQIGAIIYTGVECSKNNQLGRDLTYRTATGIQLWIGNKCRYVPVFFWRKLR